MGLFFCILNSYLPRNIIQLFKIINSFYKTGSKIVTSEMIFIYVLNQE